MDGPMGLPVLIVTLQRTMLWKPVPAGEEKKYIAYDAAYPLLVDPFEERKVLLLTDFHCG